MFSITTDTPEAGSLLVRYIELFTIPGGKRIPNIPRATILPQDTASDASFSIASKWLKHCVKSHTECSLGYKLRLPTRVLDLSPSSAAGVRPGDIRLYEPSGIHKVQYVCLSHCWGLTRCTQLTSRSTITANLCGIDFTALPKTFQDAVIATRKLRFRYLWIDCFCIVQDSKDDWDRESAQMSSIYQNAVLTLAATRATGDEVGFLGPTKPNRTHKIIHSLGAKGPEIYARGSIEHLILGNFLNPPPYQRVPESTPLLDRAWVYQERILSRRVLHFGEMELQWECLEDTTCECKHPGAPMNRYETSKYTPKQDHQRSISDTSGSQLSSRWHQVVHEYSKLSITYQKDIFPALSGVAKQIQHLTGDEYLAGAWRKTLLQDLCWSRADHSEKVHERIRPWRAPTWSWASIGQEVEFDLIEKYSFQPVATVMDCQCVPAGTDSTGQLSLAILIIRSKILNMPPGTGSLGRRVHGTHVIYTYDDIDLTDFAPDQLLCVSIGWKPPELVSEPKWFGLVLVKVEGEEEMYERVGFSEIVQCEWRGFGATPRNPFDAVEETTIKIM